MILCFYSYEPCECKAELYGLRSVLWVWCRLTCSAAFWSFILEFDALTMNSRRSKLTQPPMPPMPEKPEASSQTAKKKTEAKKPKPQKPTNKEAKSHKSSTWRNREREKERENLKNREIWHTFLSERHLLVGSIITIKERYFTPDSKKMEAHIRSVYRSLFASFDRAFNLLKIPDVPAACASGSLRAAFRRRHRNERQTK